MAGNTTFRDFSLIALPDQNSAPRDRLTVTVDLSLELQNGAEPGGQPHEDRERVARARRAHHLEPVDSGQKAAPPHFRVAPFEQQRRLRDRFRENRRRQRLAVSSGPGIGRHSRLDPAVPGSFAGRSLGRYFAEEIATPLDVDIAIHVDQNMAHTARFVYTQITDVETEANGLLTYDRAVIKVDLDRAAAVNRVRQHRCSVIRRPGDDAEDQVAY